MKPWTKCMGILALSSLGCLGLAQNFSFLKINPRGTYLRDSEWEPAPSMLAIDLGDKPTPALPGQGSRLEMRTVGWFNRAYDNPATHNVSNQAVAVFSSTGIVDSDWSNQFRVSGSIDSGVDFVTFPTWVGNKATDIPEDFGVGSSLISIEIPNSARYLILTPFDNGFWNNADDFSMPGADPRGFGLEWRVVTPVPEPATICFLGIGSAILLKRRSKQA